MRFISQLLILALISSTCLAAPIGGEVIRGSSDISYGSSRVEINQHTDRAVIDWRSFDVKAGEHVKFNLPNPSSVSLNRINDRKASEINGLVSSNGNLILLNPNGIIFGKDAVVDAAAIIASSSKVNIDEFMNGGAFGFAAGDGGKIINKGNLSAKDSGLVGLVSPHLENHGVISAKLGKVQLASSDSYTVDLAGDGLINLAISDHQKQKIENNSKINADGGSILLTASAAREIIDSLIINNGKLEAKTGSIKIYAEGSNAVPDNVAANKNIKAGQSTIINNGIIDASGKLKGQKGGTIELLADDIALLDNSKIDASGNLGGLNTYQNNDKSDARLIAAGGDIKIGGDYLGSGTTPAAKNVYVAPNAKIYADALETGDAGRVIIWADKQNDFYGNVFVQGGKRSGDGGFVETSGKEKLNVKGYVTTLASKGKRGTYLLDPTSISIYGSTTGNWPKFISTDSTVNLNASLIMWLDGADPLGSGTPPSNGSAISTWTDKSGHSNNVTQGTGAAQPTWSSNQQNGLGSVNFYGSQYIYRTTGFPTNADYSIFVNTKQTSTAVASNLFSDTAASHSILFNNSLYVYMWHGGGFATSSTALPLNTAGLLLFKYTETSPTRTGTIYQNSINVGSSAASNSNTSAGISLGKLFTGGGQYIGAIFETMLYSAALADNLRNIIEQYNSAKWAVALTPPGTGTGITTEAQRAMASTQNGATTDGYSVFTTRYLERLAASADISLNAGSGGILLDLQGDTLTLPSEVNFGLTTTSNGNITSNSSGTIAATRTSSKGNITLSAGGTGAIDLNTSGALALTSSGGDISLTAGNNIKLYNVSGKTVTIDNHSAATADVYLNGTVTATATSGNSIIMASGRNFINNVGTSVFTTSGTARYLVYSSNSANNTPVGTPAGAASIYNTTYPTIPGTSGNLYIYSNVPTLTFSPINQTVSFGSDIVQTAFSISGYVNGDVSGGYTGAPLLTSTTNTSSTIGHYANALSIALGTLVAGTYNVAVSGTHADVDVVVPPTPLSIVPDNKFKFYNWPNPPLTYKVYGLNPGDLESLVSGITLTSTAVTGSLPGVYSITPSGGTVAGGTYAIQHYIPGTLTVVKTPPSNKCPCLATIGR